MKITSQLKTNNMKKSILVFTSVTLLSGMVFLGCESSSEKVDTAEQAVTDANNELEQANQEYLADIENYRTETSSKIEANNQSIADFNLRIAKEKKEVKEDYKKKIAELESKNSDMKKKMDEYKADGKEKWEAFKTEFSHDMDELGAAFKDLTVKNVK
ncbi:MAG: peptidase M23 [Flavobacteriales bacterium CG18_big_fil_WC_8_21_14_2_50_32_9]|nr:MAG: peptidase M23 [Flavobacteriales bacterium CG18_big_fil_WC_8_21_14_2_50_32_9]PJC61754.1 MAG: peptidase M23 [Flavobacteriales bacterium CG_4_9_14_0_2_um_filter_32_27]